jgi:DNA-binding GntR family transcriptional regulator
MADWSGRPAYAQVADALRAEIRSGRFPPGSQLPSYEALMKKYEVSITVVRSAVRELKSEGLVHTHQGKGAFVRDPLPKPGQRADEQRTEAFHTLMAEIKSLHDDLDRFDERLSRLERLVAGEE